MSEAPQWFKAAVAVPCTTHAVNVPSLDGSSCRIDYLRFPRCKDWASAASSASHPRQILFVHGGSAHAHWWSHIIPFFLDEAEVVSINLSGMGSSEHRAVYSMETYAEELRAVADDAGFTVPMIVAHSFGGFVAAAAVARLPRHFAGVVLVDSSIRPPGDEVDYADKRVTSLAPRKVYPDFEAIRPRFKLVPGPEDPQVNPFIREHLLKHAVEPVAGGGYRWRYDENRSSLGVLRVHEYLEEATRKGVAFSVVWGEQSGVWGVKGQPASSFADAASAAKASRTLAYMRATLPEETPFVCLPQASHHCMVDQPLALVSALRALLQDRRFVAALRAARL